MNQVKITADAASLFSPQIVVEGLDLAKVARQVDVRLEAGILPQVSVHLRPGAVDVDLPAQVTVVRAAPHEDDVAAAREELVEALAAVDPQDLEQDALARFDNLAGGGPASTGGAFLAAVLARLR